MTRLILLALLWGCGSTGSYTHIIETTGSPTGGNECVKARVTLVAPDTSAWRAVSVANFEIMPAYDCALGGGGEQEDGGVE